ncbi:MAG: DUF222 domain-containing protein [Chloroflexi bacterium]|nr:MAG: DUF222 domain-containing protein [Chloroflexota bacterium]
MILAERLHTEDNVARELIETEHLIGILQLKASRLAAELSATRRWDSEGYNSAGDWMRFKCQVTNTVAWDRIRVGEELHRMPESEQAVYDGEIGYAHLKVMARTAEVVGAKFDELMLLPLARDTSPGKFYYKSLHFRHAVDAKAYCAEQTELVENRRLSLSTAEDGCLLVSGVLDPVGGAAVRTALEPLARKSGAGDDRELERRYADALVELACGGKPANLHVTATIETLKGMVGAAGGEMEFSLPLSSSTIERMACDCSVSRVLLSEESVVIDIGRSRRVIAGPAKRALNARDGHCVWPGCERPASWCDGHHLVHWIRGGSTDLDNLVLLCHRHHWKVHEGGWQLVKTDDRDIVPIAPTITFGRGPD